MKRLILLLLLLLSIGLHSYVCWEEDGKAIRQETNLNYSDEVISLSSGGYMLLWSDVSSGLQEMKVQKVSSEGENIWDEPMTLATIESNYADGESLVETVNGEVVAAWSEFGDPALLRLQKIDEDGNLLWGETGLIFELEEETLYCHELEMVSDGAGSVYLLWLDHENLHELKALYVNSEGEVAENWNSNGNVLFNDIIGNPDQFSVAPDGFGGIIVAARFYLDSFILQRYDDQANLHWGAEGISISDFEEYSNLSILPWDNGEYAVIVQESNELWANIIDINGSFTFGEMQLIASVFAGGDCITFECVRTSDSKLGIIWFEDNNEDRYLRTQKTAIGEEPDWGTEGILLETGSNLYSDVSLAADESGGLILSWRINGCGFHNIFYQHLDSDGNALTGAEPLTVSYCDHNYGMRMFREEETSILFWQQQEEYRDELAMQIYDINEIPQLAEQGNIIWDVLAGITSSQMLKAKGNLSAICWQDGRYSSGQTYIQAINNDTGNLLYAENGIAAINQTELSENNGEICISENCERICVACQVLSGENKLGIVQILDLDGNRLLGDDGMIFCEELGILDNKIVSSGDNEFVIVWSATNNDWINPVGYLKAQKIVNDQFVWGNGVTLLVDSEHDVSDINIQYPYISWYKWDFPAIYLKLTKITDDGSIAPGWDTGGLVVSDDYVYYSSQMYPNDTGIILFWEADCDENTSQLKGQRYSSEGDLLWEEGGRIFGGPQMEIWDYQLSGEYLYCLGQNDNGSHLFNKYSLDGEQVWDEGLTFENLDEMLIEHIHIWEDVIIFYGFDNDNWDIYAFIYDTNGNIVENQPPGGIEICTNDQKRYIRSSTCDENGNSTILWEEGRGESLPNYLHSLYVQKVDLNLAPSTEDELPDGNIVNMTNYPNPFMGSTILKCDLPRNLEEAEIVIYNIRGQKVRSLPATSNEVEWDCRNQNGKLAGSGMYFYRLQGKGIASKTGKMILLR